MLVIPWLNNSEMVLRVDHLAGIQRRIVCLHRSGRALHVVVRDHEVPLHLVWLELNCGHSPNAMTAVRVVDPLQQRVTIELSAGSLNGLVSRSCELNPNQSPGPYRLDGRRRLDIGSNANLSAGHRLEVGTSDNRRLSMVVQIKSTAKSSDLASRKWLEIDT